jgi:hypothetical protein
MDLMEVPRMEELDPRDAVEPHSLFDHPDAPDYGAEALSVREAEARLRDFTARAAGGVVFTSAAQFEEFCQDLILQATEAARKRPARNGRTPTDPWSANEQLNAVKYAEEQGFVTPLEAQRLVRKLLKLPGKRTLAVARPRARRATTTRRRAAR